MRGVLLSKPWRTLGDEPASSKALASGRLFRAQAAISSLSLAIEQAHQTVERELGGEILRGGQVCLFVECSDEITNCG